MPRDISNNYTRAISAYVNGAVLTATQLNTEADDIASALTASFTRGETTAFSRSLLDEDGSWTDGSDGGDGASDAGAGGALNAFDDQQRQLERNGARRRQWRDWRNFSLGGAHRAGRAGAC